MKETPRFEGAGQGEETSTAPDTALDPNRQRIDRRLQFLACASARLTLVEAGLLSLDQAVDAQFIENFRTIAQITCHCEFEIMQRMDEVHRQMREQSLRDWRRTRPQREQQHRPAASTLAAYQYVLRLDDPEKLSAWLERHPEIKP